MKSFTETKIATKFGDFNIRVYADTQGKETVVLYTERWLDGALTQLPTCGSCSS